jgi:hypothetical protein
LDDGRQLSAGQPISDRSDAWSGGRPEERPGWGREIAQGAGVGADEWQDGEEGAAPPKTPEVQRVAKLMAWRKDSLHPKPKTPSPNF